MKSIANKNYKTKSYPQVLFLAKIITTEIDKTIMMVAMISRNWVSVT